jgi:signal transduction histidine kinase
MPPPKLLIVEDEIIIARDIAAQLVALGYTPVGHATTGQQSIDMARTLQPDLVLMDIQLVGPMDGIAAAQTIRDDFFIPVVFVSAFSADATIARAKLTEPYGYILKPFSERELHTVIEMALYKHQAESRLRDSAIQMRALSQRVLEVQETERRRVALELHDEIGQSLTAIKINLQAHHRFTDQTPEQLNAENLAIVEAALQQVRRLALALRPSVLDDLGLLPALRWMAEQVGTRSGFVVHIPFEESETSERLPPALESACFRIAQEALTNIARHAKATQVSIALSMDTHAVHMEICDDGCGFDTTTLQNRSHGGESLGLAGMHERAALLGGGLTVASQPGQGCTVRMHCPLRAQASAP